MRDALLVCLAANGSDRDDIIGDIISSNVSNMDRRAGVKRAHVGCIIARFDD
jgi:hypothetical protein